MSKAKLSSLSKRTVLPLQSHAKAAAVRRHLSGSDDQDHLTPRIQKASGIRRVKLNRITTNIQSKSRHIALL
jgi:hypothetical protein